MADKEPEKFLDFRDDTKSTADSHYVSNGSQTLNVSTRPPVSIARTQADKSNEPALEFFGQEVPREVPGVQAPRNDGYRPLEATSDRPSDKFVETVRQRVEGSDRLPDSFNDKSNDRDRDRER
ncbi:MAG: hypothetical protein AAFV59_04555 [Pseudomonadota bacterium]